MNPSSDMLVSKMTLPKELPPVQRFFTFHQKLADVWSVSPTSSALTLNECFPRFTFVSNGDSHAA